MKRPKKQVILFAVIIMVGLAIIALVCIAVAAYFYFFKDRSPLSGASENCQVEHTRFDGEHPEKIQGISSDQLAILAVDGPPQAFTISIDPLSGSVLEEWDYFTTGKELYFLDGAYQGGVEVPAPEVIPGASIPELPVYPWEIIEEFTPACSVALAGTALFNTSALVLPGWNDGYEVARLWMLAGGGSMITVEGQLALLSVDPGEAIDLDQFEVTGFFIGTLGEGDHRLGAILSPGDLPGIFRLSLSPRGQGTTQDGTEIIFNLAGTELDRIFTLGADANVSTVDLEGAEHPAPASGTIEITRQGKNYHVSLDVTINGSTYDISGLLGNGMWHRRDSSTAQALGQADLLAGRQVTPISQPPQADPASTPPTGITPAAPDANVGWNLLLDETFDANQNQWPVTYSAQGEALFYQSDLFQDQYLIFAQRKSGERPQVSRLIDLNAGLQFMISAAVTQEGNSASDCGLVVSTQDEAQGLVFGVSAADRTFRVLKKEAGGDWEEILGWTSSQAIKTGQANQLSWRSDSEGLILYINDQQVGALAMPGLDIQRLGFSASSGSDEPVMCYFDDLKVFGK